MKRIWIILNVLMTFALFKSVSGGCSARKTYIPQPIYYHRYNYGRYYERPSREESNYYSDISCNHVSEISSSALECSDSKCKSLIFMNSNVSKIPTNVFMGAHSLEVINLANSGVRIIETRAFAGLPKMQEIHLEINSISKVTRGSLNSLISLKFLNLSRNSIGEIESDSFQGCSSIEQLDLSYNKLTSIPINLLEPLKLLKTLNVGNNILVTMNHNFCTNFVELRNLIMSNNEFLEVDECIRRLSIRKLSLSNNRLSDVSTSSFPNTLENLYMDNNDIYELGELVFRNLSRLKFMNLSNNSINNYPYNIFEDMKQLEILDISNNDMDYFDPSAFSALKQLNTLNMNGNNLTELQKKKFQNLSQIEILDISENNIIFILVDVLSDLVKLKKLNISGNRIEYLESGVFHNLNYLKILDISHNRLKNLRPHVFFPLGELKVLSIAYNGLKSLSYDDITRHCPKLELLDIDGNMFSCSDLAIIFPSTNTKKFPIKKGNTTSSVNVNGIACSEKQSPFSIKFSNGNFKNTSFYELFRNVSGNKQNNVKNLRDENFYRDKEDFEEFRNLSQTFIFELSMLRQKLKSKEDGEIIGGNTTLKLANVDEFLRNESLFFREFVAKLSGIAVRLENNFGSVLSNMSNTINKFASNLSNIVIPVEQKQFMKDENSSLKQYVGKLDLKSKNLEQKNQLNMENFANFSSIMQNDLKLLMKFENLTMRNLDELSRLDFKFSDEKRSSEKYLHLKNSENETKNVSVMTENLIIAINNLKLFIILSTLVLMVISLVKIFKYIKSEYLRKRKSGTLHLELPIIEK